MIDLFTQGYVSKSIKGWKPTLDDGPDDRGIVDFDPEASGPQPTDIPMTEGNSLEMNCSRRFGIEGERSKRKVIPVFK